MKIACDKCEKVISQDYARREDWLKVSTENTSYMLCKHCAKGFWMAVDSQLSPVVEG